MKKSQLYIFTAVLLCAVSLALFVAGPSIIRPEQAFKDFEANYLVESKQALQEAYYNQTDLSLRQGQFVADFFSYARAQSPTFKFMAILSTDDYVRLDNRLGLSVTVTADGTQYSVSNLNNLTIAKVNQVDISLIGKTYEFNTSGSDVKQQALLYSVSGSNIKIKKI